MSSDLDLFNATDPADAGDVELTPDQSAVLVKNLNDQAFGFRHLTSLLEKDAPVSRALMRSVMYMAESRTIDACKVAGIELDSASEQESRYARVRALNVRVRELEAQLGQAATPSQTAAHLKVCAENLKNWWRADGFGHVSELLFTDYGYARVTLSCHLFGNFSLTMSKTPVSDKERRAMWIADVRERGFVLVDEDGRDLSLVDCDQNRKSLTELLASALPSAKLVSSSNHASKGVMVLRDIQLYVYDLQDLHELKPQRQVELED